MVLPKEVRDWLGVEEGQSVIFQIGDDGVKVISPAQFVQSTRGALKGVWGEDPMGYLKEERSAWDKRF